jgi:hypothetical protein
MRSLHRALMVWVALLCAGAILAAALRYGVDVPFWDQWDFVRALRHLSGGELSWARLFFASQGEHQIGMQVLLSAAAWHLTRMYMPAVMVWNWITAAALCLLAMLVTRRALGPAGSIPWTALGVAAFFVFNPAAYQVWMWGLPLVHLLVPLLYLAGVWIAQSRGSAGVKIVSAAVLAARASHILASGLLLWPLFALVLPCYVKPQAFRRERRALLIAALLFAAAAAPFALGSHASPAPAGGPTGAELPSKFLRSIGNILVPGGRLYLPTGTIQNEKAILEVAHEIFGDHIEPVLEREFPLPDLVARSKAVARMVKEGLVSFRQRGSRLLWQLRIWRCEQI